MEEKFRRITSAEFIAGNKRFYDVLLHHAGMNIVNERDLVMALMRAIEAGKPGEFSIADHLDAIAGEDGKEIATAAKAIFKRIILRRAATSSTTH